MVFKSVGSGPDCLVSVLTPLPTSCVVLGKILTPAKPPFLHLQSGGNECLPYRAV